MLAARGGVCCGWSDTWQSRCVVSCVVLFADLFWAQLDSFVKGFAPLALFLVGVQRLGICESCSGSAQLSADAVTAVPYGG